MKNLDAIPVCYRAVTAHQLSRHILTHKDFTVQERVLLSTRHFQENKKSDN